MVMAGWREYHVACCYVVPLRPPCVARCIYGARNSCHRHQYCVGAELGISVLIGLIYLGPSSWLYGAA